MEATMMQYPLSVNHLIERAGTLFGDVEVVSRMPDRSLHRQTYADTLRRTRALAKGLQDAGLKPGDRVATLMWNHYAHLETYFGAPMAGGLYHTLNLRLAPEEMAFIIDHAEDRYLIIDDVLLPLYQRIADQVKFEKVFVVPLTGKPVPEGFASYEDLLSEPGADWQPPEVDENAAIGLCYTSGTTGKPKGVAYSHRALVLHSFASAMAGTLGLSDHDTLVPVVPMFHANAWGLPFTAALVGCKQVFPGPHLDPESLLQLYQDEKVTVSAGVPTIWLGIIQTLEKDPKAYDLVPGLRMIVGGAAAPQSLIRAFDKFDMRVIHAWGMTETTPLGSVASLKPKMESWPEDDQYAIRAKQGLPAPFVEVRARGDKDLVPWDGKSYGELEVRGPWVASSYFHTDLGKDKWTRDGWFRTGDVVTIDKEGYLQIVDRTKDLVKSGGEWISSVDMENLLMGHPAVAEAAVIAIPDEKWGERPLAVVVFKEGQSATEDALREHLSKDFAKWAIPERFEIRKEIPRTATGKFLKRALRAELGEEKPGS